MSAAPVPTARPPLAATAAKTTPENPWPLRLLNSKITEYVARMSPLWVEGQLVQINRRPGQPMAFMTLRDADVDMSISLVIQARDLATSTAEITDGARVVVRARPTFWPKRGTLQLQASEIRPVGLGELLARIEHLKRVLAAEGLFAPQRKVPLPFLPHRVGLICGRESKAEHDVVVNARARWHEVRFEFREVAVQGAHAVAEVCDALATLDGDPAVDVIVVARGGGSVEDLLPFSNEHLIRVAAACRTPIISAIGHETDSPLLDLVADYRASTPTDAAKRVVPDVAAERTALTHARTRVRVAMTARVTREQTGLTALRSRPVLAHPGTVVDRHEERLTAVRRQLRRSVAWHLDRARSELESLRSQCVALSPAATLERGYAVVRDDAGHVVRDAASVSVGAAVEILLASGRLEADITRTRPGPPAPTPQEDDRGHQ
ncbi:MAG: exodeoxyribonuclease VII large subunit [Actinomycetota bacterium]